MKFDLTIKDLTADQARKLFEVLNAGAAEDVKKTQVALEAVTTPETATEIAKSATLPPVPQNNPDVSKAPMAPSVPQIDEDESNLIAQPEPKVTVTNIQADLPDSESDTDTDAEGLPWDERIHSSNQQKNKDGTWRRKRGIQDFEYDQIKAELLGKTPAAPQVPPVPSASATPPPVPTASSTPPIRDFAAVLNRVQKGFQQGKCTPAYIPQLVEKLKAINPNVTAVTDIAGNDELIAAVHNIMDDDGIE